jgi:hypothetical protein
MADYPNRSDLRNPAAKMAAKAATGQTYGEAGKQIAAQQAVPMGASPTDVSAAQTPKPRPTPGNVVDLMAPTERPQDMMAPVMGNKPMILQAADPVLDELEVLYSMYPNDDLKDLLSALKFGGR